MKQKKSRHII